jgi:uncharacterized protein
LNPKLPIIALIFVLRTTSALAASSDLRIVDVMAQKNREALRALLQQHADVNVPQEDGATALAWAAYWDDLDAADLLIRAGANLNAANEYGVTPLSLACTNRSAAMVEKLLKARANPNIRQWTGVSPLMTCARTGSAEAVKLLLEHGAEVNASEGERGQTALMWAVAAKQNEVVRILLANGADIHARSKIIPTPEPYNVKIQESPTVYGSSYPPTVRFRKSTGGFSPFLFAAQQGDIELAKMLLAAGADVNEATDEDGSALIIAMASGHEEFARYLLEHGANPNSKDPYGITALHYALHDALLTVSGARKVRPTDRLGWLRPNMPELVKLLLQKGADPNAKITSQFLFFDYLPVARHVGGGLPQMDLVGVTPFMLAAASGDTTIMRILLEAGANPRVATPEGVTPFMLAAGFAAERGRRDEKSAIESTKLALQMGGDVNSKKDDGRTALHTAVVLGWQEMIRLLVENGADLEAKDMYRQTPMTIALGDPEGFLFRQLAGGREDDRFRKTPEQPKIVDLLVKLGASPWTGKRRDRSAQ